MGWKLSTYNVLIVGNPNSGKTTIFNKLCNRHEKTGNFNGVTASVAKGVYKSKNDLYNIYDLPGIYSLNNAFAEELVTKREIEKEKFSFIINVVDGTNLVSGLKVTKELFDKGYPVLVVLTKYNELDVKKLKEILPYNLILSTQLKGELSLLLGAKNKQFPRVEVIEMLSNTKKPPLKLFNQSVCLGIFFISLFISLYVAFGKYSIGTFMSDLLNNGITYLQGYLGDFLEEKNVSGFVQNILCNGILGGVGSVLSFIPQVVILHLLFTFLEESGLVSIFAVVFHKNLSRVGLSGKVLFPLTSGLGCTAVSCRLCNNAENDCIKKNALSILPNLGCLAKNTVYIYICKLLFKNYFIAVCLIYVFICVTILFSLFFKKKLSNCAQPLIMELPSIAFPNFKVVLKRLVYSLREFIFKISVIVFFVNFILSILVSVSFSFEYVGDNIEDSILCFLAKKISILFYPIGLDWKCVISLICGVFAKESVIGVFALLGVNLTKAQGVSFLIFFILYPPCVVSLASFKYESNFKFTLKIFIKQMFYGYIGALIVYKTLLGRPYYLIILLFWWLYAVLQSNRKNKFNKTFRAKGVFLFPFAKTAKKKGYKGKWQKGEL